MTALSVSAPGQIDTPAPIMLEPRHWLAALAMMFVLLRPTRRWYRQSSPTTKSDWGSKRTATT